MKAILAIIISVLQITTVYASDNAISSSYLLGKWSTEGKAGCTTGQAVNVAFYDDHTLKAVRANDIVSVGFWEVATDRVVLHLLVSPRQGQEAHSFYQQKYYYQYMAPTILGVRADSIDFTHDTGVEAGNRKTLTRCM